MCPLPFDSQVELNLCSPEPMRAPAERTLPSMDNASSPTSANKTGAAWLGMLHSPSTAGAEKHLEDFIHRHIRHSPAQVRTGAEVLPDSETFRLPEKISEVQAAVAFNERTDLLIRLIDSGSLQVCDRQVRAACGAFQLFLFRSKCVRVTFPLVQNIFNRRLTFSSFAAQKVFIVL